MSVQKKNGRWYAAVYLGTKNKKQEYEWSEGFEKKSDAQLEEIEMRKRVIQNKHKVYDKESFANIGEKWLAIRQNTVAATTFRRNKEYYNCYIKPYFEDFLIKDIEPMNVIEFMLSLNKAPETVNKAMNLLKQIFDFAITLRQINYNPCFGIKKPPIKQTKKKTWDEKQIARFLKLKDTKDATCYIAFMILFSTAMRPGEVCGLRWCDWYGDHFTPSIGIDEIREETNLKNKKAHDDVFIDILLQKQIEKLYITQQGIYKSQGKEIPDDGFINCLMPDFRPMTVEYLRKRFGVICKRNNLEKIQLYSIRHSLATNMMREKVNPAIVCEIMRHSDVTTTLNKYSQVDKGMYKDAIKEYNNKFLKRVK